MRFPFESIPYSDPDSDTDSDKESIGRQLTACRNGLDCQDRAATGHGWRGRFLERRSVLFSFDATYEE